MNERINTSESDNGVKLNFTDILDKNNSFLYWKNPDLIFLRMNLKLRAQK